MFLRCCFLCITIMILAIGCSEQPTEPQLGHNTKSTKSNSVRSFSSVNNFVTTMEHYGGEPTLRDSLHNHDPLEIAYSSTFTEFDLYDFTLVNTKHGLESYLVHDGTFGLRGENYLDEILPFDMGVDDNLITGDYGLSGSVAIDTDTTFIGSLPIPSALPQLDPSTYWDDLSSYTDIQFRSYYVNKGYDIERVSPGLFNIVSPELNGPNGGQPALHWHYTFDRATDEFTNERFIFGNVEIFTFSKTRDISGDYTYESTMKNFPGSNGKTYEFVTVDD
jgi:hypothetical protein